jgi:hypothetical protein
VLETTFLDKSSHPLVLTREVVEVNFRSTALLSLLGFQGLSNIDWRFPLAHNRVLLLGDVFYLFVIVKGFGLLEQSFDDLKAVDLAIDVLVIEELTPLNFRLRVTLQVNNLIKHAFVSREHGD